MTPHRRAVISHALATSGWTIVSEKGAGAASHPAVPGVLTLSEALLVTRRGLLAKTPPTLHLTAEWPLRHAVTQSDDMA